jgi:tRNA A58 N-methylase Trm61
MNYPVTTLIQGRLNKNMRLFEYGSGYSTLFFSKLVGDVVSVEYDLTWYEKISKELPKNAQVVFVKNDVDGSYCRAIHQVHEFFDVVVVDGRDRVNCIKQALAKLNESGVILLDDSQREYYQEGIDHAVRQGFKRLDIEGLKPGDHRVNRTTIFYRSTNCFNL